MQSIHENKDGSPSKSLTSSTSSNDTKDTKDKSSSKRVKSPKGYASGKSGATKRSKSPNRIKKYKRDDGGSSSSGKKSNRTKSPTATKSSRSKSPKGSSNSSGKKGSSSPSKKKKKQQPSPDKLQPSSRQNSGGLNQPCIGNNTSRGGPSVMKTLTALVSIPANRSCADCRSALVDISKVHASFCPSEVEITSNNPKITMSLYDFKLNHNAVAPPDFRRTRKVKKNDSSSSSSVEAIRDEEEEDDAAKFVNHRFGGHGVFICSKCADAHRQLSDDITIVQSIHNSNNCWTLEQADIMANSGGNAKCWTVYEAYMPNNWKQRRPCPSSTLEERLLFCKAKYQALAFVMPPPGPLSALAWTSILERNQIAQRFGSEGLKDIHTLTPMTTSPKSKSSDGGTKSNAFDNELPNRLIDHFCVVSCSMQLHPNDVTKDLSKLHKPEELQFWPSISDCYPDRTKYQYDFVFPEHLPTFVLPDGCCPSTVQKPPKFFTTVLTQANGKNLYGGCLQIYDESVEMDDLEKYITNSGYQGKLPRFFTHDTSSTSDILFLPRCLILISHHPFFDVFRVALRQLYRITLVEAPLPIERYIANLTCEVPLPPQGKVKVELGITTENVITIERPPINRLPMANFSFRPLFASLSVGNILVVYSCLLEECKIVLLSQYTSLLCPVAEALLAALFPLEWQGLYMPLLPYSLIEILDAPVPFLVGIHSRYLHQVDPKRRPQDVVFVDLDRDVVHMGFDDESGQRRRIPRPPDREIAKLKNALEEAAGSVYLVPNSGIKGCIMAGTGRMGLVDNPERPKYAHMTSVPPDADAIGRKEIFTRSERAYDEHEATETIGGFRTVHGHLTSDDDSDEDDLPDEGNSNGGGFSNRMKSPGFMTKKKKLMLSQQRRERANQQAHLLDLVEPEGFSSPKARDAFLRFLVTIFMNYKRCLRQGSGYDARFEEEKFLEDFKNSSPESIGFIRRILQTQMFQRFLEERQENPDDSELRFFDESIVAKKNRSKKSTLQTGKKPTPFLDSDRWKVTKAYTPPQPSNLGLPDSDRTYHYGTFPKLDYSLFGRIRPPMMWQQESSRTSIRLKPTKSSRKLLKLTKTKEDIVRKAMKPILEAPEAIASIARRSAKDLESALTAFKATSMPSMTSPLAALSPGSNRRKKTDTTKLKKVQIPAISPTQKPTELEVEIRATDNIVTDRTVDTMTKADIIIMNARRKQSILLDLIVKVQASMRMAIRRRQYIRIRHAVVLLQRKSRAIPIFNQNEPGFLRKSLRRTIILQRNIRMHLAHLKAKKRSQAVLTVQKISRGHLARVHLAQAHGAAVVIQRLAKTRRTRFLFLQVRLLVSKVQGVARGRSVRRRISLIYSERMSVYRTQLVRLWDRAFVSLALRTRLWPMYREEGWGFARLRLAENEVCRLLNLLGEKPLTQNADYTDETINRSDLIGIDNSIYRFCKTNLETSLCENSPNQVSAVSVESAAAIEAERLQVYEKLDTSLNSSEIEVIYSQFNIPSGEKMKKVCLANAIWSEFTYSEQSYSTMLQLFPELESSPNIIFRNPSSKARRRFSKAREVSSPPIDKSLWDAISLEGTIKRHVQEVASIYITKVPALMAKLDEADERKSRRWKSLVAAIIRARSVEAWSECRGTMLHEYLLDRGVDEPIAMGEATAEGKFEGTSPPKNLFVPADALRTDSTINENGVNPFDKNAADSTNAVDKPDLIANQASF